MGIMLDKELVNKNYKDIWMQCMSDGLTIPYLIKMNTDREYYPSSSDRNDLSKKLSEKQKQDIVEAYYNRRLKEKELWDSTHSEKKRLKLIEDYKEKELGDFIKKYSKYEKLII